MSNTVQSVSKVVPVSADRLFAVIADPTRHVDVDGSEMVRGAEAQPITEVGDVFTVAMHVAAIGDYSMDNHVVEFEPGRRIAWAPGRTGGQPVGHLWVWEFDGDGESTTVTHTYDWTKVSDDILARVSFPVVSPEQMAASIDNLASAATA